MKLGFEINSFSKFFGNFFIELVFPKVKLGLLRDRYERDEIWAGIQLTINNDIHYEKYDYGFVFCFVILGFGIIINKTLL